MNAFDQLRRQARDKRDAIIRAARLEYGQACKRINSLRNQLQSAAVKAPAIKFRRIADVITEVIPHDHAFTVGELVELVTAAEPGRVFQESTIRTICQRLEAAKTIRRVGRTNGKVCWAAADYRGPVDDSSTKRLPALAAEILKTSGPMKALDLLLRIQARGYRVQDNQRLVLRSLRMALWRCAEFQRDKTGRWSVLESAKNAG